MLQHRWHWTAWPPPQHCASPNIWICKKQFFDPLLPAAATLGAFREVASAGHAGLPNWRRSQSGAGNANSLAAPIHSSEQPTPISFRTSFYLFLRSRHFITCHSENNKTMPSHFGLPIDQETCGRVVGNHPRLDWLVKPQAISRHQFNFTHLLFFIE